MHRCNELKPLKELFLAIVLSGPTQVAWAFTIALGRPT